MASDTFVYVDGFNLYYRALKGTSFKWLDLPRLVRLVLGKGHNVVQVNYYTAHVSAKVKLDSPKRQQAYLSALRQCPEVKIHLGSFMAKAKMLPRYPVVAMAPTFVEVLATEEKGSDVNLASHLVFDACKGRFKAAAVITNDTDLVEPVRIVAKEMQMPVGLLCPVTNPHEKLVQAASFVRRIRPAHLKACQFANPFHGVAKPIKWCIQDRIYDARDLARSGAAAAALDQAAAIPVADLVILLGALSAVVKQWQAAVVRLAAVKPQPLTQLQRREALEAIEGLAKAATVV